MLFDSIKRFFGLDSGKSKSYSFSDTERTSRILRPRGKEAKKLERIISRSELVDSGQVHLLGLTELKQDLGDKWPELRGRILNSLERIITTRISKKDVFFSRSDEEHIIVFSNASENAARLTCAKILQELSEQYLGSSDTSRIIVKTAVGKIEGKLLFSAKSLDEIFQENANAELSLNKGETKGPLGNHFSEEENPYYLVYAPVWDAVNETISTYIVNVRSIDRYKNSYFGYKVLIDPSFAEKMIELDHFVLEETIETMDDLFINNFRAIFSIPVCYETLFNSDMLQEYLSHCKNIPKALRKYITFNLIGFPIGAPEIKLRFIVSSLRSYSRAIFLQCDEIPQDIVKYKDCGIKGVSIVLVPEMLHPIEYWERLTVLVGKCRKESINVSLAELNRKDDIILAKTTGANFLSGDVIGPYLDVPGHMLRLSWNDLVRPLRRE